MALAVSSSLISDCDINKRDDDGKQTENRTQEAAKKEDGAQGGSRTTGAKSPGHARYNTEQSGKHNAAAGLRGSFHAPECISIRRSHDCPKFVVARTSAFFD